MGGIFRYLRKRRPHGKRCGHVDCFECMNRVRYETEWMVGCLSPDHVVNSRVALITGHCVSVYRALGPHSDQRWSSLPRQLCQSLCFASAHFIGNVRGIPPAKDSPAFLPASKS